MNIQIQCCGSALMLVLLYFYRRQRRIQLNTGKAFWRVFCVTMGCILLDISSVIAITYREKLPDLLVELICKSYLVSLVSVGMCSFLYVCVEIYSDRLQYRKVLRRCLIVASAGAVLIYLLPIHYHQQQNVLYTYGASDLVTYLLALGFVISNFILIFRKKHKINPRRREAVQFWMLIWICAALVQFFRNDLLIVGYACALGIMILYLILENPEGNLDRYTGLFSHEALVQYMKQLHNEGKQFSMLSMTFQRSYNQSLKTDQGVVVRSEIIGYLSTLSDAIPFKNAEDEIILLFSTEEDAEDGFERLSERFSKGWGEAGEVSLRPIWMYIPDSGVVSSAQDLLYLMKYIRMNHQELSERDFLRVDENMVAAMYREKETERLILRSMEQGKVEVFYQPIYSTQERRFTSAEALVRIRDEDGKLVPPGLFIDIAEKNGMILRLGEIVFEKVCRFIREEHPEQYGIHYIEVNLSVVQCAYERLAETYIQIMKKYDINPKLINLEITESASLRAKKMLLDNMKVLMDYGVKFSLDDFGTGQSNLNYIVDMPVDIVKFDRDMINAYFENGKAKYVMDAAMHMIHGLKLQIVSEGIETKEQYEAMDELGIRYIQGYYFSKPLPEQEFLAFVIRERTIVSKA